MLLHYRDALDLTWQQVRPVGQQLPPTAGKIDALLAQGDTWEKLYAAEQAMVFFLPVEMVNVQIDTRFDEADRLKLPSIAAHKKSIEAAKAVAPPAQMKREPRLEPCLTSSTGSTRVVSLIGKVGSNRRTH